MLTCKYCFRTFETVHLWHIMHPPLLCRTCYLQLEWHHRIESWQGFQIESFFEYGPTFQKMIHQFKSNLDIELGSVLLNQHTTYLKCKYWQSTFVLAPTHEQDVWLRGFHPLIEIFKKVSLPMISLIEKSRPYKQSDQHGHERQQIHAILRLKKEIMIPKQICLVDDVMTTGETLKAMISLLKPISPRSLKILVLARKKQEKIEITSPSKNDKISNWKQQRWHG